MREFAGLHWSGLKGIGPSWCLGFSSDGTDQHSGKISTDGHAFLLDARNQAILLNSAGSLRSETWEALRAVWHDRRTALRSISLDAHFNVLIVLDGGYRVFLPNLGPVSDVAAMISSPKTCMVLEPHGRLASLRAAPVDWDQAQRTEFPLQPTAREAWLDLQRLVGNTLTDLFVGGEQLKLHFRGGSGQRSVVSLPPFWFLCRRKTVIVHSATNWLGRDDSPKFWDAMRDGLKVKSVCVLHDQSISLQLSKGYHLYALKNACESEPIWSVASRSS